MEEAPTLANAAPHVTTAYETLAGFASQHQQFLRDRVADDAMLIRLTKVGNAQALGAWLDTRYGGIARSNEVIEDPPCLARHAREQWRFA